MLSPPIMDTKVYMKKVRKRSRWRRFSKNPRHFLFPHKIWVPSWVFHEGACHGNVSFPAIQGLKGNTLWKITISRRENSHKTYFHSKESNIVLIVQTLILRYRNWSYTNVKNECHLTTFFSGLFPPEYMLTCNAVDFFFSSSLHWRHIIGWVRKSGPMAHVLNKIKKKKVKSDGFTNHSVAQVA